MGFAGSQVKKFIEVVIGARWRADVSKALSRSGIESEGQLRGNTVSLSNARRFDGVNGLHELLRRSKAFHGRVAGVLRSRHGIVIEIRAVGPRCEFRQDWPNAGQSPRFADGAGRFTSHS